ncbi:GNAT family N-acetyltransferase [Flexivirga sp. B27]
MRIRTYQPADLPRLIELTIATFRPFYEESFPALMDHEQDLIHHQHGHWADDYRAQVPQLHDPVNQKHVAVAEDEGTLVGYVAWLPDDSRVEHGIVDMLAVDAGHRRTHVATDLMEHAMDAMRASGTRYVELGTGGDWFHAPARAFYESLGFHPIPTVAYLKAL